MTAADDRFNDLMATLDRPMVIVTTADRDVRAGCLVGFHVQCGIDPGRYAIWLSKANHTYRIGALATTFAVHFPTADQRSLAELFGTTTGDEADKFEACAWHPGPGGVPLLDDCADYFVGHKLAWLDAGTDHVCLIVDPVETSPDGEPGAVGWLTYSQVADLDAAHDADERQHPV